jgi:hypothetical protein
VPSLDAPSGLGGGTSHSTATVEPECHHASHPQSGCLPATALSKPCTLVYPKRAGKNNRGLIEVRPSPDLSLQDKARATTLSSEENRDRQQLYAELAKANNIPPERLAEVGSIFADVNRQEAQAGWWIQGQDGAWKQK